MYREAVSISKIVLRGICFCSAIKSTRSLPMLFFISQILLFSRRRNDFAQAKTLRAIQLFNMCIQYYTKINHPCGHLRTYKSDKEYCESMFCRSTSTAYETVDVDFVCYRCIRASNVWQLVCFILATYWLRWFLFSGCSALCITMNLHIHLTLDDIPRYLGESVKHQYENATIFKINNNVTELSKYLWNPHWTQVEACPHTC